MSPDDAKKHAARALRDLEARLNAEVIGQTHVVRPIAEWVLDGELGLNLRGRPRGCFFFLGPTGTGKTQLIKELARILPPGAKPVTFDMSEFQTLESVEVFLGRGGEDGGRFGKALAGSPSARVLLLDEMDKAHRGLQDLFLQGMDEGRITTANGHAYDLRNFYIAFTSNIAGAAAARMRHNSDEAIERMMIATARRTVRPEWFARVDLVCCFRRLSLEVQERICRLHVEKKLAELATDGMAVKVEGNVYQFLLGEGFTELDGARPLVRAIQKHINKPIRDAWMRGSAAAGVLRVNETKTGLEFVTAVAA